MSKTPSPPIFSVSDWVGGIGSLLSIGVGVLSLNNTPLAIICFCLAGAFLLFAFYQHSSRFRDAVRWKNTERVLFPIIGGIVALFIINFVQRLRSMPSDPLMLAIIFCATVALVYLSIPHTRSPLKRMARLLTRKKPEVRRIDCLRTYISRTQYKGEGDTAVLYDVGEKSEKLSNTAIAEFVNSPKAKGLVLPIPKLRAQITFYDSEGNYCHRVSKCHWLKETAYEIQLEAGDRAGLAIASWMEGAEIIPFDNYNDDIELYEKKPFAKLTGKSFRVEVLLIGGINGDIKEEFAFDLTCEPALNLKLAAS